MSFDQEIKKSLKRIKKHTRQYTWKFRSSGYKLIPIFIADDVTLKANSKNVGKTA